MSGAIVTDASSGPSTKLLKNRICRLGKPRQSIGVKSAEESGGSHHFDQAQKSATNKYLQSSAEEQNYLTTPFIT
ncbi:MAG: hypothetical protein QXW32_06080 [Nitrososphaerales archaeon]